MNASLPPSTDDAACFELQYRANYLAEDARQTSIAIAVWLIPVLLFAYPEYLIFGLSREFVALLTLRLVFCGFSLYTIAVMQKVASARDYDRAFLRWATFATVVVLIINCSWAPYVAPSGAITILILFSSYMVFPNKLSVRLAFPIILSLGNIALQWFVVEHSSTYASLSTLVALIMVNVLGMIFSSSVQKHRRTEFKARLEETRIKEKLSRLASVDELTGVFNRRKLLQLATLEFERFKSNGHQFSVLMIDIDHFKQVNDTYGHDAGDKMLTKFASFVANKLREKDLWGRWGGEEFVLVLPGLSCEQAKRVAERLRLGVKEQQPLPTNEPFPFTISIGLSEVQTQDQTFEDVLKRADEAMYIAKRNGRNRTEVL